MKKLILFTFLLAQIGGHSHALANDSKPKGEQVKGGIAKEVIDETVKRHMPQIRYCYTKELNAASKPLSGKVRTHFVIGAEGSVIKATVKTSTLNNDNVEKCIVGVIEKMAFPAPEGGGKVDVTYPFSFQPSVKKNGSPTSSEE